MYLITIALVLAFTNLYAEYGASNYFFIFVQKIWLVFFEIVLDISEQKMQL